MSKKKKKKEDSLFEMLAVKYKDMARSGSLGAGAKVAVEAKDKDPKSRSVLERNNK